MNCGNDRQFYKTLIVESWSLWQPSWMDDSACSSVDDSPSSKDTPLQKKYWWHVNKGGFPIPTHTWEKMWDHVIVVHPEGESLACQIRGQTQRKVPIPIPPALSQKSPVQESLFTVQHYMNQLQYNHTGTQFFDIRKSGPLSRCVSILLHSTLTKFCIFLRLMESAKEIIRESLPIKCLEAVILALYLTSPLTSVQRFAIGFKSKFGGLFYRHIVLGVHSDSLYGALGMSRRDTLMYKPLTYLVKL